MTVVMPMIVPMIVVMVMVIIVNLVIAGADAFDMVVVAHLANHVLVLDRVARARLLLQGLRVLLVQRDAIRIVILNVVSASVPLRQVLHLQTVQLLLDTAEMVITVLRQIKKFKSAAKRNSPRKTRVIRGIQTSV